MSAENYREMPTEAVDETRRFKKKETNTERIPIYCAVWFEKKETNTERIPIYCAVSLDIWKRSSATVVIRTTRGRTLFHQ